MHHSLFVRQHKEWNHMLIFVISSHCLCVCRDECYLDFQFGSGQVKFLNVSQEIILLLNGRACVSINGLLIEMCMCSLAQTSAVVWVWVCVFVCIFEHLLTKYWLFLSVNFTKPDAKSRGCECCFVSSAPHLIFSVTCLFIWMRHRLSIAKL